METSQITKAIQLLEQAWVVIANVGHGDWNRESEDWRKSAVAFRDGYDDLLELTRKNPDGSVPELPPPGAQPNPQWKIPPLWNSPKDTL